jgi:hypothetical protein
MGVYCKHCGVSLGFRLTEAGKKMPVERTPYVAFEGASLSKGTYIDGEGKVYRENKVPLQMTVWRVHWGDCRLIRDMKAGGSRSTVST